MGLQDPTSKMSKSTKLPNDLILLIDSPEEITKKIKKAVTDSENVVKYSDDKPGIKNLINIYSAVTDKTVAEIEEEFKDSGYGKFKQAVADAVADLLEPIQEKYAKLSLPENDEYIKEICRKGAAVAHEIASEKLKQVQDAIGFRTM